MNNWERLSEELASWPEHVPFWWRDDDAVANSGLLLRMLELSIDVNVPVHLAVIPSLLENSLNIIKTDRYNQLCYVLQHGYDHQDYSAPNERKIELGGLQDADTLIANLQSGKCTLSNEFKTQYTDILVPPWNRISDAVTNKLTAVNYAKISVINGKHTNAHSDYVNVDLDIIDWQQRRFAGEDILLEKMITQLTQYHQAHTNNNLTSIKPYGIMTHHLVHDEASWLFLAKLFKFLIQHNNVYWVGGNDLLRY